MSKTLALALVLVFLTASSTILAMPVSGAVAENTWTTRAPMHVARSDLGVAVVNGKIYAIGGNTESGYMPNSGGNDYKALGWIAAANEEYNPETDTWTLKTSMPTPRCNFAIVAFENKIYCIGGIINWAELISYTAVNEVYDPATDTWETKAPMPNPASARANVANGKIYVIGGGSNETLNQVYDPATDTWTLKKPMSTEPRFLGPDAFSTLVSAQIDSRIYVMSYSGAKSGTWVYNPVSDSWVSLTTLPLTPLHGDGWWSYAAGATTGVNAAKRIYVFFERYPYSTSPPCLAFDPSVRGWTNVGELSTRRRCFGVAAVNDTLYVIGGRTYDYPYPGDGYFTVTEQALTEQYMPLGYGTPDPSYDGTPPQITIRSPENMTYYASELSLNFTVNEPVSWASYKLDNETETAISSTTTMTGLSLGSHSLTLYAADYSNNMQTLTIQFTIAEEPKPEPFPALPIAAVSIAAVALVAAGLLVYHKKHKNSFVSANSSSIAKNWKKHQYT